MITRVFSLLLGLILCLSVSSHASSWEDLGLNSSSEMHWTLSDKPSPKKPGSYYLENRTIKKCNGYIGAVTLYPSGQGITPEEEIHARMDRFIAAQPKDLSAVRTYLTYGDAPAEQLVYVLKDEESHKILAWFIVVNWAHNGKLYSLNLCSLSTSPLEELDQFFIAQLGPKTLHKEEFLPKY